LLILQCRFWDFATVGHRFTAIIIRRPSIGVRSQFRTALGNRLETRLRAGLDGAQAANQKYLADVLRWGTCVIERGV
jgi:hypothetical protein